jgi:cell division protease FtsH
MLRYLSSPEAIGRCTVLTAIARSDPPDRAGLVSELGRVERPGLFCSLDSAPLKRTTIVHRMLAEVSCELSVSCVRRKLMHAVVSRRWLFFFAVFLCWLASACVPGSGSQATISLGEAVALSKTGNFSKVLVDTGSGTMTMIASVTGAPISTTEANGKAIQITNGEQLSANIDSLNMADLQTLGFVFPPNSSTNAASSGLSTILLFVVLPLLRIVGLIFWMARAGRGIQNQAMGFARSRARLASPDRPVITFADVADAVEAKEDLQEVVEFLRSRWKFQSIGATIPKGILLIGPPGTGKTLLARAVAGEAKVPFFSVSGSEFVEMFVGVGASRVRDMFAQAKRSAPCIIFIDEIDAVGRIRSGAMPGSHEEREQTLNQILVEMDGFDPNMGVVVLAATNRADVLDPALLRPGRFDRRVVLDRPDTAGRAAILQIHAKNKKMADDVDLAVIAGETHGFSGADLANLMNEAAILAVRRGKKVIEMNELEEAIDRVLAGPERKSLKVKPKDKELTAYHEAGHALVAHMLPNVDPVHKISIVARGSMGGYTRLLEEDRYFITKDQFKDTLATFLAGHAAEEMMFNQVSTGPHSDIRQATDIARKMITEYGMSDKLGLRAFGHETPGYMGTAGQEERDYSEEVARKIDEEEHRVLDDAHVVAKKVLLENRPRLVHLARRLLVKETLEGAELETAFAEPLSESDMEFEPAERSSNGNADVNERQPSTSTPVSGRVEHNPSV